MGLWGKAMTPVTNPEEPAHPSSPEVVAEGREVNTASSCPREPLADLSAGYIADQNNETIKLKIPGK